MIPYTQICHPNQSYQIKIKYYNTKNIIHNVIMVIGKINPKKLWQNILSVLFLIKGKGKEKGHYSMVHFVIDDLHIT